MIFFVFLPFSLCFSVLKACSFERFQEIFFDDIQKDIQDGRIDLAIAKAKQAAVYDQQLCSQSKFCKYRTRLIQHLVTISDEKSLDDSLAELPLFESTESAVQDWELFLKAKGEFSIEVFESGVGLIQACPAFFLKYDFENNICSRKFYDRYFLNRYQRDILRGRSDLAIQRAKLEGIPVYLRTASSNSRFAKREVELIEKLQKLNIDESVTKEAAFNPFYDTVDEAVNDWGLHFDVLRCTKTDAIYEEFKSLRALFKSEGAERPAFLTPDFLDSVITRFTKTNDRYERKKDTAKRFIRKCPFWFTKKYAPIDDAETFKTMYGLHIRDNPDFFEGDGELISVYDDFEDDHGVNVASIACDNEFGLARGSKYESRSCYSDFMTTIMRFTDHSEIPCFHTLDTKRFSSIQADWTFQNRMIVKIDEEIYEFTENIANPPQGKVINCSFGERNGMRSTTAELSYKRLARYRFVSSCITNGQAVVFAAGNHYMDLASLSEYNELLKSFANVDGAEYLGLLTVVALDEDALNISFSNQPGNDPALANITVCAPGVNVDVRNPDGNKGKENGTSFAAPFVSAIVAIIRSNLTWPVSHYICQSILKSATPIVMRSSKRRLYDIPVALVDVTAGNLEAGKTYQYIPFGKTESKAIYVDQVMIDEGRKRYGMGRVHLERALNMAIEMHGGKRKIKQVQP